MYELCTLQICAFSVAKKQLDTCTSVCGNVRLPMSFYTLHHHVHVHQIHPPPYYTVYGVYGLLYILSTPAAAGQRVHVGKANMDYEQIAVATYMYNSVEETRK